MPSLKPSLLQASLPARQHGVVLFIALIVMVALSLAAIALIRSVDTTTAVIGNLAFRQASILPANLAVEEAAAALFQDADVLNAIRIPIIRDTNLPAENYFAFWQNSDDARGVPAQLQKKTAFTQTRMLVDASLSGPQTEIRYVIERMCVAGPPPVTPLPNNASCDMVRSDWNPGDTIGDAGSGGVSVPYYRVTVRVDGPKNTASFVQAMLR